MALGLGIGLKIFNKKWRKINKHNSTRAERFFYMECVEVGKNTYGSLNVLCYNKKYKLRIGNFCSIAPGVCFLVASEHMLDNLSTYPFKVKCMGAEQEAVGKGDIIVDDDVWIGYNATILSGVHIGQGAVVAAGAVVSHDVPPYAIVAGVPAKIINYRFSLEIVEKMKKIDYSKIDDIMISENIDKLYNKVTDEYDFSWLPKKE